MAAWDWALVDSSQRRFSTRLAARYDGKERTSRAFVRKLSDDLGHSALIRESAMTDDLAPGTIAAPDLDADRFAAEQARRFRPLLSEAEELLPVDWRELAALVMLVVLSDLAIYRGHGFAGYAALFAVSPALLAWGAARPRPGLPAWLTGGLLLVLAAKAVWCGSPLVAAAGFSLLAAFVMALSGQTPYVVEAAVFASLSIGAGYKRLLYYGRRASASSVNQFSWLNAAMPLAALVAFGTVFILANPDLLASVSETSEWIIKRLREWLLKASLSELAFVGAAAWVVTGLLRQASGGSTVVPATPAEVLSADALEPSKLYPAFRNTLWTVIALFGVYLAFEFQTLWFREFPRGFYYSGYAHEGAAWLTGALALATALLSLVFRGGVLRDPRLPNLKRLGWIWSAENFILAVAVYHRMAIYVDFNGMSPMRVVGLYGISTVVAGFGLVLWKIGRQRSFGWLVRRQLWALALAAYLFILTPVDAIVVEYNVRRILSGDPASSVQISVHPIGPEGVLLLEPLLDCSDPIIREGVRAMLAERDDEAEAANQRRRELGWTAYQLADEVVLQRLRSDRAQWAVYRDRSLRVRALSRFHEYAYQWY